MKKKSDNTVLWWLGWITLTILAFFVSCYFWTGFIAERFGSVQKPGITLLWVAAVFGSWMVLLVPLIILMYAKVDKAYEDARIARETATFDRAKQELKVKSVLIDETQRILNKELMKIVKTLPETIKRGHLVNVKLRDGREIQNVFIANRREVLGVYDADHLTFRIQDIVGLEPVRADRIPNFKPENWLRLDGVG